MTLNHHCSVVELNGSGILIEGKSGSGKTSLACGLIERAQTLKKPAAFVCDDQALLQAVKHDLIATVPQTIAGRLEIRGYGIVDQAYKPKTAIRLVVRLIADEKVERLPEPLSVVYCGCEIPCLEVPERHEARAIRIVMAWIDANAQA